MIRRYGAEEPYVCRCDVVETHATEAHVCEQLAQGCRLKALGQESNVRPSESQFQRPNQFAIKPPGHQGVVLISHIFRHSTGAQ